MKTLMMTLAATAALGLVLIAPASAQAGQVHLSISLGIPAVLYGPPVVYRPAVEYRRVTYSPTRHFDYRHYYRHDWDRDFDHHRSHASDNYHHQGYGSSHNIGQVRINPRLRGR